MSLYTKYRPKTFADVAGQDTAIAYLENIITKNSELRNEQDKINKIPHAYLFAGGHGIGKTTLARIFARKLGTSESDIYELDAASSSKKIENMREIIESVWTLPLTSQYKVYIFDEAHMLTKESSNAFLKTLEEPPAHVIFILCTTDPDKLISTVRSRCNIINLRNPSLEELVARLEYIIKSENIILNDKKGDSTNKILNYIASHSNNSFRDSITNLEKVLHTHREKIDKKELEVSDIENIFGKRSVELYMELFAMLTESVSQDKADLIANVKDLENEKNKIIENVLKYCKHNHSDFSYSRMLECFRNGMLIRNKIDISDVECNTVEYKEFVIDNAKLFTSANLLYLLNNSELHNDISDKECVIIAIFGNFVER